LAHPWSGHSAPTVILGHGCAGIIPHQTRSMARALNSWGYNAVAVDSLGPRGLRSVCKARPAWGAAERTPEIYTVARITGEQSWHAGGMAYVGWSHGGSLGLVLGSEDEGVFSAIVSYYPSCHTSMVANRSVKVPTLLLTSKGDTWTPPHQCEDITGITRHVMFDTATHAWDIQAPDRVVYGEHLRYDLAADAASLSALKEFLKDYLSESRTSLTP